MVLQLLVAASADRVIASSDSGDTVVALSAYGATVVSGSQC